MSDEIKVTVVKFPDRDNLMLRYIDPMTGKPKHKTSGTTNRKDAVKAAGKWEAELREGRYSAPCRIGWRDFCERYEAEVLPQLAPRTAEPRATIMAHIDRILSPRRVTDLTADRLSYFQAELRKPDPAIVARAEAKVIKAKKLVDAAENPQELARAKSRLVLAQEQLERAKKSKSEATIKGNLAHLRSILTWAVAMGMLREVPIVQMPSRNLGGGLVRGRPVTGEEFDRMLARVPDVRPDDSRSWERYLRGLWLSGLRLEESLRLSWDADGDFVVDLSGKFPRFRIYAEAEKGHKDRLLPMTPDFAEWLLETPKEERQGVVFHLGPHGGKQRSAKRVSRTVSRIGEMAGVVVNKDQGKFASCHDLRRSFGTRWASRVKPATLQLLMRHSTIETTLRYYVAQDADDVAAELWKAHETTESGNRIGNNLQNPATNRATSS